MDQPEREAIARVVHEALRAFRAAHGQEALPPWSKAPAWMRQSTFSSVAFVIDNPDASASATHDLWLADKQAEGWRYAPVKDAEARTHPLMIPYDNLPEIERRKDALLAAIVRALTAPLQ